MDNKGLSNQKLIQKHIRIHPDVAQNLKYWTKKRQLSESEYVQLAIEEKVARENGDYELPTLEQQRLNQLIDEIRALSTNQGNLERVIVTGFDSLQGLTRGDSYLMDEEDGELFGADAASGLVEE